MQTEDGPIPPSRQPPSREPPSGELPSGGPTSRQPPSREPTSKEPPSGLVYPRIGCAKKLNDGMGGNPLGFYQGAHEPLGLSEMGRSILVSSMPLKGTGEAEANCRDARLG
jgi:hypothetical protein